MNRRLFLSAALALLPLVGVRAQERKVDVVYGHKTGVALTMDVFTPKEKPSGIGVIFLVSGGWVSNHNNINPGFAKPFTDRGHVVFEVVHGSQPKFTIPEIETDIDRAVRYIRTHAAEYGVDPERLGICGASAGGHLSLMQAAYGSPGKSEAADPVERASSAVQAVAVFFPPTDFLNWGGSDAVSLDNAKMKPFLPAFGIPLETPPEKQRALLQKISPYYGITEKTPPILLIHGDADSLVPIQQSQHLMEKLKEKGVASQLVTKPGLNHGWAGIDKDLVTMAEWFEKHLGGK